MRFPDCSWEFSRGVSQGDFPEGGVPRMLWRVTGQFPGVFIVVYI